MQKREPELKEQFMSVSECESLYNGLSYTNKLVVFEHVRMGS